MIINTRNKSYASKGKYDPPHTSSSPSSSSLVANVQVSKNPNSQGNPSPLPSFKCNILNQLANIKVDVTLLDMASILEKQKHLKIFKEGKASTISNLFEEVDEDDSTVNKVGVHNFRHSVKNPPFFFYFCKDYGQNSPLLSD
jgi:hypothetical protein